MEFLLPFLLTLVAGLSTVLGAGIFYLYKNISNNALNFFLGMSAGVMLYLSFIELLPESVVQIGFSLANIYFFMGMLFMFTVDRLIPHKFIDKAGCNTHPDNKHLYRTGLIVALGLALHNFPEGVAVFMGTYTDIQFGYVLAAAIALHNIPEGIALAAPIYRATGRISEGIKYSFFAGIIEPVGGLFAFFLFQSFLTSNLVYYIFALVAGVMVYIGFDELLPICLKSESKNIPIFGITIGMIFAALSIFFLNG